MRIRKHFSKILGTASLSPSYSPPPAAATTQIWSPWNPHADTGVVCELNRSSWDVLSVLPSPSPNHLRAGPQGLEIWIEGEGDAGNETKCKELQISSNPSSRAAISVLTEQKEEGNENITVDSNAKGDKKRRRSTKNGSVEANSAAPEAAIINTRCKKSDGKTWKCKRQAHHPHTLCEYHLNQLRSYNSNPKLANKVEAPVGQVKKRRKAMADEEVGSNYVYYYNGFGPCRGKRRGDGGGGGGDQQVTIEEEEEQEKSGSKENSDSEDGRNTPAMGDGQYAPIVGDDEARKDQDETEDNQQGCDDTDGGDDSLEHSDEAEDTREKKRNYLLHGKGRRKRVKARSLKSLL